jgi:formylglycine-generating enzyme required for sulfatase activity
MSVSVLAPFAACHDARLPPKGEALVIVDTDVPIPKYASRMRIDVYTADGTGWRESRDTPLRDPGDWPASFSLFTDDLDHEHTALLRVRVYPEGRVRDYRGERFSARDVVGSPTDDAIPPAPSCDVRKDCELPRLIRGDVDVTPTSEPHPYAAIDRLVRVRLRPGVRGSVRITMRGVCLGTMADLAGQRTCVDRDATLVDVKEATLAQEDMSIPKAIAKDFGVTVPCPLTASPRPAHSAGSIKLFDEEVCVPGGTYFFGEGTSPEPGPQSTVPERVATIPPFYLDKYEVTVARWRDAIARGFAPPSKPQSNAMALPRDTCNAAPAYSPMWCTYSDVPRVPEDRETYPLSCLSWDAARAFCQFEGGDLPTEAQWEYVARAFGRDKKSDWPWGDVPLERCEGHDRFQEALGVLGELVPRGQMHPGAVLAAGVRSRRWFQEELRWQPGLQSSPGTAARGRDRLRGR